MAEDYTPYDYNKHNVLKVPVALYAAMVYLCKYLILFVVPRLPRISRDDSLAFLENSDITRTDLEVTDGLFERVSDQFSEDEVVELTATIAWENCSSKFNRALRVDSQELWPRTLKRNEGS